MRDNWTTAVATPRLLLLPYRRAFVPVYHAWMADPHLLESTCSERLTLPEELAAQRAWVDDPRKCTFLLFDRAQHLAAARPLASTPAGMLGDANLFLLAPDAVAEDYFGGAAPAAPAAEVMVMVAEPAHRRKGYAAEAVAALLRYGAEALGLRRFVAKVGEGNAASLALFARLGFSVARRVAAFEEVHLVWEWAGAGAGAGGGAGYEVLPCAWGAAEEDAEAAAAGAAA